MRKSMILLPLILIILIYGQGYNQYEQESGFSPDIGMKAIAGKVAILYVSSDYGITPCFGIWADLGHFTKEIGLDAGVEYWNAGRTELEATVQKSDIGIYATIKYDVDIEKIRPFLGGGLGVNIYKKKYPDEWDRPDEKKNKLELHIDMGARYSIHPKIDLEGRFKANFSDVSAYGLHISALFKVGEK
ncbi:outer membrane beta-barrel protein [bacterium]|nr:outer membrane beta-barrel protein [bacterium]